MFSAQRLHCGQFNPTSPWCSMSREFHPQVNGAGTTECAYAGCGKEIPAKYYLCRSHYYENRAGLLARCPSQGCGRFRSVADESCADCRDPTSPELERRFHLHINGAGTTECAYAGCGKEIPAKYYLCRSHYYENRAGLLARCPSQGCGRFRSVADESCADCRDPTSPELERRFHLHINGAGTTECAYAGCGKEIPAKYYLCRSHYYENRAGLLARCPSQGCGRFRSVADESCADCRDPTSPELEPEREIPPPHQWSWHHRVCLRRLRQGNTGQVLPLPQPLLREQSRIVSTLPFARVRAIPFRS